MGVMGLFLLGSCNSKSGDGHEGHNHETENMSTKVVIMIMKAKTTITKVTNITTMDIATMNKQRPDIVTKSFCLLPKRRLPE